VTDNAADRVARFVDDLLHGRRPRRFAASKEEAEAMTAAAGLVAGRLGADIPDKAALDRIHRKLSEALDESPVIDLRPTRRTWLRTLGTAAAAVVVGVALDEVATHQSAGPDGGAATVLMPDNGTRRPRSYLHCERRLSETTAPHPPNFSRLVARHPADHDRGHGGGSDRGLHLSAPWA